MSFRDLRERLEGREEDVAQFPCQYGCQKDSETYEGHHRTSDSGKEETEECGRSLCAKHYKVTTNVYDSFPSIPNLHQDIRSSLLVTQT